jgi:hypothetical protein
LGFGDRTRQSDTLIQVVKEHLWDDPSVSDRFLHVPFGQETHLPGEAMALLRDLRNNATANFIRFAPDFFVIEKTDPEKVYLLEYKCTQTPLYSMGRIRDIGTGLNKASLDWPDIGQWEMEPYNNYIRLTSLGVKVAVLNYCAYHNQHILCDFVDAIPDVYREKVRLGTVVGSGTPYVNFDLKSMRSLQDFLCQEHNLDAGVISSTCSKIETELLNKLPIRHHRSSPLYGTSI